MKNLFIYYNIYKKLSLQTYISQKSHGLKSFHLAKSKYSHISLKNYDMDVDMRY